MKYRKLTSLHYTVRATKSHIQNSRNNFARTQSDRTTNWLPLQKLGAMGAQNLGFPLTLIVALTTVLHATMLHCDVYKVPIGNVLLLDTCVAFASGLIREISCKGILILMSVLRLC